MRESTSKALPRPTNDLVNAMLMSVLLRFYWHHYTELEHDRLMIIWSTVLNLFESKGLPIKVSMRTNDLHGENIMVKRSLYLFKQIGWVQHSSKARLYRLRWSVSKANWLKGHVSKEISEIANDIFESAYDLYRSKY